jgi:chromosome segregation protein
MRAESRRQKFQAAQDKKVKMTMDLNALKSRINLLTEMEKDYQGYSKSVKIVMQEASRGGRKRIHGPVAELVKTDAPYSLASETAFGGSLQHVVVESDEDGKAAINLLKRRDGGRATFLPLSTIRGTELREKGLAEEEGFEGLALDLVRFDENTGNLYESSWPDCRCRSHGQRHPDRQEYGYRFRIVTLDGQVINAGGSMTGGSTARNAGFCPGRMN